MSAGECCVCICLLLYYHYCVRLCLRMILLMRWHHCLQRMRSLKAAPLCIVRVSFNNGILPKTVFPQVTEVITWLLSLRVAGKISQLIVIFFQFQKSSRSPDGCSARKCSFRCWEPNEEREERDYALSVACEGFQQTPKGLKCTFAKDSRRCMASTVKGYFLACCKWAA